MRIQNSRVGWLLVVSSMLVHFLMRWYTSVKVVYVSFCRRRPVFCLLRRIQSAHRGGMVRTKMWEQARSKRTPRKGFLSGWPLRDRKTWTMDDHLGV